MLSSWTASDRANTLCFLTCIQCCMVRTAALSFPFRPQRSSAAVALSKFSSSRGFNRWRSACGATTGAFSSHEDEYVGMAPITRSLSAQVTEYSPRPSPLARFSARRVSSSTVGLSTSSQSEIKEGSDNEEINGDGGGDAVRALPDFSAFAYGEGLPTSVVDDVDAARSDLTTPNSGSKRTRAANSKGGKSGRKAVSGATKKSARTAKSKSVSKQKAKGTPGSDVENPSETVSSEELSRTPTTPKKKRRTAATSPSSTGGSRRRIKVEPGSLPPPKNWLSIYELVEELRKDRTAPVDTDGGHELPQRNRGEKIYRFQVLVALMLSSQTKDAVVGETMRALQKHGLDVENIRKTPSEELNTLIGKVGFHNNKTKYIKQTVEILANEYGGDIPPNATEIMKLPGVGPKMSYIVESVCFDTTSGIGVDTHMHRIFNILGWVNGSTPERTREQLEGWLPRERWGEVNVLWVGFGQEVQQQKEKTLRKALSCSRPIEALGLLKKLGLDPKKEAKKIGLEAELKVAMGGTFNRNRKA